MGYLAFDAGLQFAGFDCDLWVIFLILCAIASLRKFYRLVLQAKACLSCGGFDHCCLLPASMNFKILDYLQSFSSSVSSLLLGRRLLLHRIFYVSLCDARPSL